MNIEQAIGLIDCPGISATKPSAWADFGAGTGTFTNALAGLLMPGSRILAIDKNPSSLRRINVSPTVILERKVEDFTRISLPPHSMDGILMANALHFVKDKTVFLQKISAFLAKDGSLIVVEYDLKKSNPWVPYPVGFHELDKIFKSSLHMNIEKIAETPSVYNRAVIYGAYAKKKADG